MLKLVAKKTTSRKGLIGILRELESFEDCLESVYIPPGMESDYPHCSEALRPHVSQIASDAAHETTGIAIYKKESKIMAVAPPFAMNTGGPVYGMAHSLLKSSLVTPVTVGVVLLRLGRFAVAVLRDDALVSSKTGTRHVKNRHKAGGSSQRRFARSRDRLVREFYDGTCKVLNDLFMPYEREIDHVMLGGEKHTLIGFRKRCQFLAPYSSRINSRILRVHAPNQEALKTIHREVWRSNVYIYNIAD